MLKRLITVLCLATTSLSFNGCKKESNQSQNISCPISDDAIEGLELPTYDMVLRAYEKAVALDPALEKHEEELSCAIFKLLKEHPDGSFKVADWGPLSRVTRKELKVFFRNPYYGFRAWQQVEPSGNEAWDVFGCDPTARGEDTKADAVRHAYWNARMVIHASSTTAELFGNAHEDIPDNPMSKKQMDLHNNEVGRNLAIQYPEASDAELLEMITQLSFVYLASPDDPIPASAKYSLVFFSKKQPYDVTMFGSMTNPDSGGPWNMVLDLNQCGNVLRGQFIITRGIDVQKRRFVGTLNGGGVIRLNIAQPYSYEGNSQNFCADMVMDLSGSSTTLSGNWTSTNCSLGGTTNVSK